MSFLDTLTDFFEDTKDTLTDFDTNIWVIGQTSATFQATDFAFS